jgi:hypothetical protein
MAKVFVSYKYDDGNVAPLPLLTDTKVRDYVDVLQKKLESTHHINKGENDGEDLSSFKDETIASKLRDKIYDSSITVVMVSAGMVDDSLPEDDQWIPWEISYSLKEVTRSDRTSRTNGMLAVILPDAQGCYGHFVSVNSCPGGCSSWHKDSKFDIIGRNMFNRKVPNFIQCPHCSPAKIIHSNVDHSFIHPVLWSDFISNTDVCLGVAERIRQNIGDYNLSKVVVKEKEMVG